MGFVRFAFEAIVTVRIAAPQKLPKRAEGVRGKEEGAPSRVLRHVHAFVRAGHRVRVCCCGKNDMAKGERQGHSTRRARSQSHFDRSAADFQRAINPARPGSERCERDEEHKAQKRV